MEILIIMAVMASAFVLQMVLGHFQIKNFNKGYSELRSLGPVAIGRRAGGFRSGTIVLFALDKRANIIKAKRMQGVTVWAKMKELTGFEGKNLVKLTEADYKQFDKLTRVAICDAIQNYKIIKSGGEIAPKPSLFERVGLSIKNRLPQRKQ